MALGTTASGGGSYLDRAFSTGGDAFTAYIDAWRKAKDTSSQIRIINAQGEQDRISRATQLPYDSNAQPIDIKTHRTTPVAGSAMPAWAKWAAVGIVAALGAFVLYKVEKK